MKYAIWVWAGILLLSCEGYDEATQFAIDEQLIADYVTAQALVGEYDNSGVFVAVQDTGISDPDTSRNQDAPFSSDTIIFTFDAYTLSGTQISSSGAEPVVRSTGSYPTLSQLNDGLREGLPYFRRQGSGVLIVPSTLAYGPYGTDLVEPNEVIRFEVELLDFY